MKVVRLVLFFIFSIFILSCKGKERGNEEVKPTETEKKADSAISSDVENYSVELNSTNTMFEIKERDNEEVKQTETGKKEDSASLSDIENYSVELNSTNTKLEIFEITNNEKTKVLSLNINIYGGAYWITKFSIYFQNSNKFTRNNPIRLIERFDIQKKKIVSTPFSTYDLFAITDDEKYICFSRPDHKELTDWGPIYAQNIYIYDTERQEVLHTYNVLELVNDDFYGGIIECSYNKIENRFDFVFSMDADGNYGTAYIDISDFSFHR